jgi:hypothetical protein
MGLLAAENIVEKAGHDLWAVNTDYEYQENIAKTGLSRQSRKPIGVSTPTQAATPRPA